MIRTTIRRVVLDVVVTNAKGEPARDLTKADFTVTAPQKILFFDANDFSPAMDYVPPPLPPQPANTYQPARDSRKGAVVRVALRLDRHG